MSSMTFVVSNLQQRESLGLYHIFGTKGVTFWESLDTDSRAQCVNADICRSFFKERAWDIAGLVLEHWNNVLIHAVQATFKSHRTHILRGRGWDGAIDCWMIGDQTISAVPKIVLSCIDLPTVKRFMGKLSKDKHFRSSGFDLVGRRGCLQHVAGGVAMGGSLMIETSFLSATHVPDKNLSNYFNSPPSQGSTRHTRLVQSQPSNVPSVQVCGLQTLIRFNGVSPEPATRAATIGGLIIVDDDFYYLTAAHPFVPSINSPSTDPVANTDSQSQGIREHQVGPKADIDCKDDVEMEERADIEASIDSGEGPISQSALEHNDSQDWKMISWQENDEDDQLSDIDCRTSSDGSGPSGASSPLSNSIHETLDEPNLFKDALIFPCLPTTKNSSPSQAIASFEAVDAHQKPLADPEKDWALLNPRIEPTNMINQVQYGGTVLHITKFADLCESTRALLVRSKYGEPQRVICSRAASLISTPKGDMLTLAHKVYKRIDPGDSGAWIIDSVSGDLLGIVVAASRGEEHGYMLPSTAVVAAMKANRPTVSGETTAALPSKNLFSERPNLAQGMLSRAVKSGSEAIVSMLLNQSIIGLDVQGQQGDKLLRTARASGVESIVNLLLDARAGAGDDEGYFGSGLSSGGEATKSSSYMVTRRKRASKPKIRTGCKTCRIRRIKCDETKPSCKRCSTTGRKCDGYEFPTGVSTKPVEAVSKNTSSLAVYSFASIPPTPITSNASTQDRRLFHRFQYCTLPALGIDTTSFFWTRVLGPMPTQEPVIHGAITALAALHEDYQDRCGEYSPRLIDDQSYRSALKRYGNAMRDLNQKLNHPSPDTTRIAITASILFAFFEVLRRNNIAMVIHYQQGMRELLRQISPTAGEPFPLLQQAGTPQVTAPATLNEVPQNEIDDLLRVFAQFDIAAVKVNKDRVEPLTTQLSRPPSVQAEGLSVRQLCLHLQHVVMASYQLIKSDARMFRYWAPDQIPSEWQQRQREAVETIGAWSTRLAEFALSNQRELRSFPIHAELKPFFGLWMHLEIALIELKMTDSGGPETSFDLYNNREFEDVVSKAELLASDLHLVDAEPLGPESTPFIMTFGVGYPLYFVATKCRDRGLRRRAAALLKKVGKEGLFEGPIMAVLALHLIALEEEGLLSSEQIPERNRFHEVKYNIDYDRREILFEATRAVDTSWKNFAVHRGSVPF